MVIMSMMLAEQARAFLCSSWCRDILQLEIQGRSHFSPAQHYISMNTASAVPGVVPTFKCGPAEICNIIVEAQRSQEERQLQQQRILAGSRRNGDLQWMPDFLNQQLVEASAGLVQGEACRELQVPQDMTGGERDWLKQGRSTRAII